jgi:hypothetical protein
LAQLHLIVRPRAGSTVQADEAKLDAELATIVRDWQDALAEELGKRHGEEAGLRMATRFGRACRPATSKTSARPSPPPTSNTSPSSPAPTTCACRCIARAATARCASSSIA